MNCPCGHDSLGRCEEVDYSEQDALIDASLARTEGTVTCPDCGESWTAPVSADPCGCKSQRPVIGKE